MKFILTVLIALLFLVLIALAYAWSGLYNIAATKPHWNLTKSYIELLQERSIAMHSDDVRVPILENPELREAAISHYHQMCRLCHGAPAYPAEAFTRHLYPTPPAMTDGHVQNNLSTTEIYWIVKHGIKMTAMPAFGPTHPEEALWGLVALVSEIPRMDPMQYRQHVEPDGAGHGHGQESSQENVRTTEGHRE